MPSRVMSTTFSVRRGLGAVWACAAPVRPRTSRVVERKDFIEWICAKQQAVEMEKNVMLSLPKHLYHAAR
jgi:hypothetical protein